MTAPVICLPLLHPVIDSSSPNGEPQLPRDKIQKRPTAETQATVKIAKKGKKKEIEKGEKERTVLSAKRRMTLSLTSPTLVPFKSPP